MRSTDRPFGRAVVLAGALAAVALGSLTAGCSSGDSPSDTSSTTTTTTTTIATTTTTTPPPPPKSRTALIP